jgi:diguanylate cyclase (GGDEF)-like protein
MSLTELLVRKLDTLNGKAHYFVASIALLGTLLVGSSIIAWHSSREQQGVAKAFGQTLIILRTAQEVKMANRDALRGERGFVLTGDPVYLELYSRGRRDLAESLNDLGEATANSVERAAMVSGLRRAASDYLQQLGRVVALAKAGEHERAVKILRRQGVDDGLGAIDKYVDGIIEIERVHMRTIKDHSRSVVATMLRFIYLMSATGLGLLLLAVLSAVALRRSFARERIYRDELQKRAGTDELTGVANRRQLLTVLDMRIAEARRTGTPLSFAMFDLDNFKNVNDTHGHAVGDRVIRHVVRTALRMVRVNDLIGRLGGEEFGIILPKAAQDNAFIVCERLRARLRDESMPLGDDQHLHMTISSGIACLTDDDDAASLMERADQALYTAKRDGRDQVRLAA